MRPVLALALLCASLVAALPNQTPAIDAVEDISAGAADVDIDQTPAFDTRSAASEPLLPLDDFTAVELEERAASKLRLNWKHGPLTNVHRRLQRL